jgi:hypothetical protein
VDALIDDYCRAGFGPAARPVRRYFDRLEALLDDRARKQLPAVSAFTPDVVKELCRLLEEARKKVGRDTAFARRLDFLEVGLRWTEVEAQAHALLADPAKADKAAAKKVLDRRRTLMREIFQKTPLALNVAYISWGEDAGWRRLGYRPPQ